MAEGQQRENVLKIESDIKAQAVVIESVRTNAAETEDLVGRVIEAMDLLHHALHGAQEDSL